MILENQKIEVVWNGFTKKHYKEKGYSYTRQGDKFYVNVEDLPEGSNKEIIICCDYCDEKFLRPYNRHLKIREFSPFSKDNCDKCKSLKATDIARSRIIPWSKVISEFKSRSYSVLTKEEDYKNGATSIEYICNLHPEVGSQFISYHELMNQTVRETGYVYQRGCRMCNQLKFKEDVKNNYDKYYKNHRQFKLDINVCKKLFEEKGAVFEENQIYQGDKHKYKYTCKIHPDIGIQEKTLNKIIDPRVKYACRICGIESRSKENSYRWKGGVSTENEKARQSKEYKTWKEQVFERDGYMCMACGDSRGGNLQAHHILNFNQYPELRFDVDNGITLCNECHNPSIQGSFHNIFGVQNNTMEELNKFIELKHQQLNLSVEKLNELIEERKKKKAEQQYVRPASTKLTKEMVEEIIVILLNTDESYEKIGKMFNVSGGRIFAIAKGRSFKDITKAKIIR
jgi:5-methylcytosine-specific restriction endonuclease McrA